MIDKDKKISCTGCPAFWLHSDSEKMFKWLELKKKEIEDMEVVKGFFLAIPYYSFFYDFKSLLTEKKFDELLTGDICCRETIDFFKINNIIFMYIVCCCIDFLSVRDKGNFFANIDVIEILSESHNPRP